jgi:hypothetical protein
MFNQHPDNTASQKENNFKKNCHENTFKKIGRYEFPPHKGFLESVDRR